MKLRRLCALLLVLVLVITNSPIVSAEPVAQAEPQILPATDMLRSAAVKYTAGANYVERGPTTGLYGDDPRIDTLLTAAPGEFNKSGEEWPWIAYKVTVPATGTYTLGVVTNSCKWANFKLPMVVDGKVYTLTFTAMAQQQTAQVILPAGEHVVTVFWPMPANESEVYPNADWNSYLWCNIASVVVDSALTVTLPTTGEVERSVAVKEDVDISAVSSYVLCSAATGDNGNGYLEFNQRDAVKADKPYIGAINELAPGQFNKAGEEWGWFACNVTALTDGTYKLGVNIQGCRNAPYSIPLCVNGQVYTLSYAATGAQSAAVEVALPAGTHTVVMFMPMPSDEAGTNGDAWVVYPWCNVQSVAVDGELTVSKPTVAEVEACFPIPEKEDTVVSAVDSNYMLWSAAAGDNGNGYLEFNQRDAVKADKPYIGAINELAPGQFNKAGEEWGWFACNVTALTDGTYKLGVNIQGCRNAPYSIPLCVNGQVYTLSYAATGAQSAAVEVALPAGTHTVVMFMPMPSDEAGTNGDAWVVYPWCNVQSVAVDGELTVSKPTVAEVEACFPIPVKEDAVISAVDTEKILLSATIKKNAASLDRTDQATLKQYWPTVETLYADAPNKFNASGSEWNWFAYKVTVSEAGTYTLGVTTADSKYDSYKLPLCVNGELYALQYTAKAQAVTAEVTLPAGEHVVVMFMPLPAAKANITNNEWNDYHWCDVASVTVDGELTVSKPTVAEVEAVFAPVAISAVNTDKILLSATIKKNDASLGRTDQSVLKEDAPSLETLYADAHGQFNASGSEWNWFSYKIKVPSEGTYTLGVKTADSKYDSYKLPLCVNGELYALQYTAKAQAVTAEVTLPAGEHVVVMFMPMPDTKANITNNEWNDYHWCDVESVIVPAGMTIIKPTVAEVEACFPLVVKEDAVISAVDESYLLLSATIGKGTDKLSRTDQATLGKAWPAAGSIYADAYDAFNKTGEEWNWFAYKVTVSEAGTYTLGVTTAGSKNDSYKLPLCVNGEVYALQYTAKAQAVTTEVTLPAGEHVVVMFMPMPGSKAEITNNAWNDYHWCDVASVTVDGELTVSKPTVAEVEAVFALQVLSATNTDYMLLSKPLEGYAGKEFLERGTDGAREDLPYIDSLYSDMYEQFNKSGEEWSWFAYKVTVPAEGDYILGLETKGCKYADYKIPMIVDGEIKVLTYTAKNQTQTAELTLSAGEHIVLMFMPIPQNSTNIQNNIWNDYPWCNVKSVVVSAGVAVSKPTVAETEGSLDFAVVSSPLWNHSALFVGDSITYSKNSWASVIGNTYKMDWTNGGIAGATISDLGNKIIRHQLMANAQKDYDFVIMHGGINDAAVEVGTISDSWNVADFDTSTYAGGLETLFYYAYENYPGAKLGYIINYATPNADSNKWKGTQDVSAYFTVGKQICEKWGISYIDLYFGSTADGKSYSYDILQVDKVAENFINNDPHEIHLSAAGYNLICPYIAQWMETLTVKGSPIPAANSGKHIDTADAGKVLFGGFTAKNQYADATVYAGLFDRVYTGMAEDGANIEMLPYAKDMLGDWAFASVAVEAAEAGEYTVAVEVAAKVPGKLGMLVDGTVYTLQYTKTAQGAYQFTAQNVSLTKGKHYITVTAAMPNNDNEMDGDAWNLYPWTNIAAIVVDEGLEVLAAPSLQDVTSKLSAYKPLYTRVEAEDAEYVLYNNYNTTNEANNKASGGHVVGGAWNSIYEQTFEELEQWLDAKHNAYVEYAVVAPEDGEYEIRVGFLAGSNDKSVAKPHIAVIVNGTTHKAAFTKNWNQVDKVKMTVSLKKGLNIIRCTSITVDQPIYKVKGWVNHDFLDLDTRLTPMKHSSVVVEAESSRFVNKLKVQAGGAAENASGMVLGSADRKYLTGLKLTISDLTLADLKQMPYCAFTVNAPKAGYYPITMHMSADGRLTRGTLALLVDGQVHAVKYARTDKTTAGAKVDMLVYLTEGEHILTFTTPIPETEVTAQQYAYYWSNFDYLTLYDGLTMAKVQKAPTNIPSYTRVEVEEVAMFNLCSNNGWASGNAYYKSSQSVKELRTDGIDATRTPFVELTANAKKAGYYVLYVGVNTGMTAGNTVDDVVGTIMVETNGKMVPAWARATKTGCSTIVPVWVKLEEGANTIRMTHFTSDTHYGGTTWVDFDYIEMPYWVSRDVEFAKVGGTLEAEDFQFSNYSQFASASYSGGCYLGDSDYDQVDEIDITFEKLDPADLSELPYVTYRVYAEKAGTYAMTIGFAAGLHNYTAAEIAAGQTGGFAVVVNGQTKQLVQFQVATTNGKFSRLVWIELQEGENEVTVTGPTSEYVTDRMPRKDETYRLIWVDQDFMVLSGGLSSMSGEADNVNTGDSDFDHDQLDVQTPTGETPSETDPTENDPSQGQETPEKGGWGLMITVGFGILILMLLILLLLKKRKKEAQA